ADISSIDVKILASGENASGCLIMKAIAVSSVREQTAVTRNLLSCKAPFSIQSLMRPVPVIPNRIIVRISS
ncbi:MAG: hypothetical protein KBS57_02220, partial [Alistipes sp.]|nr:hypothetical protein [Candidatus Minthomonas equi]